MSKMTKFTLFWTSWVWVNNDIILFLSVPLSCQVIVACQCLCGLKKDLFRGFFWQTPWGLHDLQMFLTGLVSKKSLGLKSCWTLNVNCCLSLPTDHHNAFLVSCQLRKQLASIDVCISCMSWTANEDLSGFGLVRCYEILPRTESNEKQRW